MIECVKNGDIEKFRVILKKKGILVIKLSFGGLIVFYIFCLNGNVECFDVLFED